ncbi:MAG: 30S ribosomal protein S9 [Nitrososphaerota archaeon]|nr:30S ribosomal protein S9 [Nitrososphaerota archaeon]MDG6989884.1 30S ribosomal protein S9 [Nitrososphaerota archaeon]
MPTATTKAQAKKGPKLYSGARKTARATAAITPGGGRIRVNGTPVELWEPEPARLHLLGPVQVVGELREKYDLDVSVSGGGFMGQADAAAMAIARAFVDQVRGSEVKDRLNAYNKYLLSGDPRQAEPKKFGGPGARRKRQKSYR